MKARPKILVLTPDFPPGHGGIQLLVERVVSGWDRLEPRVLAIAGHATVDSNGPDRVDVRRTPRIPLAGQACAVAALNARAVVEALRWSPDMVVCAHVVTVPAGEAIRRLRGTPYLLYGHGKELAGRPRLTALGLRNAAATVAVSRYTEALLRRIASPVGPVHLIAPGVDPPSSRGHPRDPVPTVVCVARLADRYKGHDVLIRAMPLLRARVAGARLVIVGDGPLQAAHRRLAVACGLDGAVTFTGRVGDAERDGWLERAHAFAMVSRLALDGGGEGFGITYLEASAHGIPVVAGRVAGALDAVVDGVTGLLVDPEDHVAVAEALAAILGIPDLAARLSAGGREHAARHSWAGASRQVEDAVLAVLRR